MAHPLPALCAAVAASAGVSAAASGAILFSYEDPTALMREFNHLAPTMAGQPGTLTYDNSVIHRFVIDASEEAPGVRVTVDATLHFIGMTTGPVTQVGNLFAAETAGSFEFRTTDPMPQVILSGTFSDGVLTTFFGSGSSTAARNDIGGTLLLTAGPALFSILSNAGYNLPVEGFADSPASASWSLVNIQEPINANTLVSFPGDPDKYFPNFAADNAFVARAVVAPTPGALSLAGLAAMAVLAPRRRRK